MNPTTRVLAMMSLALSVRLQFYAVRRLAVVTPEDLIFLLIIIMGMTCSRPATIESTDEQQ